MRSGNGKHRRPRQTPAFVVAAGVTGAGIALPLIGATGAQAADVSTWDRVAECESGGVWDANSGNGYYGGLQMTLEMWHQHGGANFAERPDLATRGQQIAVGEVVVATDGPNAWPTCADSSGLGDPQKDEGGANGGGAADSGAATGGDAGRQGGAAPTDGGRGSDAEKAPEAEPTQIPDGSADSPGRKAGDTPSPSTTDDGEAAGTGRHRGDADAADERSDGGASRPSGRHASPEAGTPGDGSDRESARRAGGSDAPSTADPTDSGRASGRASDGSSRGASGEDRASRGESSGGARTDRSGHSEGGGYVVRAGDNLSVIAEQQAVPGGWPHLYASNKHVVGGDPDLIHPGQTLRLDAGAK